MDEQQLAGGIANAGRVTRSGGHVLRPTGPYSASIRAFLLALRAAGFDGAPLPDGMAEDGRERFVFIEGDVPVPPYPDWAQSDAALASMVVLMRRFHDAARPFDAAGEWSTELSDPAGGRMICHNDVCLANLVFRDGVAVALLDFDFAAPGRPVYDVMRLASQCVPIDDEVSAARIGWHPADKPARLRLVADAYGLDTAARQLLMKILADSVARGGTFWRRRVEAGDPNFIKIWNEAGGAERFDRRRRWWAARHEDFIAALR